MFGWCTWYCMFSIWHRISDSWEWWRIADFFLIWWAACLLLIHHPLSYSKFLAATPLYSCHSRHCSHNLKKVSLVYMHLYLLTMKTNKIVQRVSAARSKSRYNTIFHFLFQFIISLICFIIFTTIWSIVPVHTTSRSSR